MMIWSYTCYFSQFLQVLEKTWLAKPEPFIWTFFVVVLNYFMFSGILILTQLIFFFYRLKNFGDYNRVWHIQRQEFKEESWRQDCFATIIVKGPGAGGLVGGAPSRSWRYSKEMEVRQGEGGPARRRRSRIQSIRASGWRGLGGY